MAKDEKMNRFNSKIAREAEKNKLIETAKRKVRPPPEKRGYRLNFQKEFVTDDSYGTPLSKGETSAGFSS
jgi:hypothetical protein